MTFALVRREATEEMIEEALRHNIDRNVTIDIIESALSASPPLTDEEVDRLCYLYETTHKYGPADHWEKNPDGSWTSVAPLHMQRRDADRARMRAFISRIGGNNE